MYGKKLKELLKEKGVKQKELSKMLGVPETTISTWTNQDYLRLENIEKICRALNIETWEFFIDKEKLGEIYEIPPELVNIAREIKKLEPGKKNGLYRLMYEAMDLAKKEKK